MRDNFVTRLMSLAEKDPNILLLTGDLGFGVLTHFEDKLPKQFLNVGVAEQNMTGVATGLAFEGKTVFTYSIGNFVSLRCLEQLRNDAFYHELNVNAVCIGGGFSYGSLGMSHHATEDLAIFRAFPDVTIVSPCDKWEAAEATEALAKLPGPSYLRLDKSGPDSTRKDGEEFEIGKARVVREGSDFTVVVCGGILEEVLEAADSLSKVGVEIRVLSMHTIKPLDREALLYAAKETGGVLTVEEHTVHGGLGGAVAEWYLDSGILPIRFGRVGLRAGFSSIVGSQKYLRTRYEMDAKTIEGRILKMLREKESELQWARPL